MNQECQEATFLGTIVVVLAGSPTKTAGPFFARFRKCANLMPRNGMFGPGFFSFFFLFPFMF